MAHLDEMVSGVKRLLVTGGAGLLAAFGLAACGGEPEGDAEPTEASASTVAEETDTAEDAAAVSYGGGTAPEAPLEPGAGVEIGDWAVVLGEAVVDADPAEGNVYVMVELQITYNGADSSDPYMDLIWSLWGGSEQVGSEPLALAPEAPSLVGGVASGETASGNVVIEVPEGDYSSPSVLVGEYYSAIG